MNRIVTRGDRTDRAGSLQSLSSIDTERSLRSGNDRLSLMEARHRELDARLSELGRHLYLTPNEQREAAELKKLKLRAKDEIASLRRVL
jgi:uncharacterized protein YdcH (DUF465 family)